MKGKKIAIVLVALATILVLMTGCKSTRVERVSSDTVVDLSGYWNDTDVRIVAESLIADCVNAPAITNYIRNKFPQ